MPRRHQPEPPISLGDVARNRIRWEGFTIPATEWRADQEGCACYFLATSQVGQKSNDVFQLRVNIRHALESMSWVPRDV